jgi:hypothetical protein
MSSKKVLPKINRTINDNEHDTVDVDIDDDFDLLSPDLDIFEPVNLGPLIDNYLFDENTPKIYFSKKNSFNVKMVYPDGMTKYFKNHRCCRTTYLV